MTSQATILRSPCGNYTAAAVHQFIAIANNSGALVDLPAPVFTVAVDEDSDDEAEEGGEGGEGEGEGEGGEEAADQPKKKKAKHAQDKPGPKASQNEHDMPKPIRVLAFHANQEWMMYQSDDKYIHLYHLAAAYPSGFKHIVTVSVPKKVQDAVFHTASSPSTAHFRPEDSAAPLQIPHILVADKSGDVFLIAGTDLQTKKIVLGHLSGVTGLEFFTQEAAAAGGPKAKSYCLSSDSDGKIRVSNAPNYFDIQSFCMGHTAFVSAFAVVPATPQPAIVSGGSGSELILWQLHDGKPIARLDLAAHKPASAQAANSSESASATPAEGAAASPDCYVSQVTYVPSAAGATTHTVLATVYPWACVFLLTLDAAASTLSVDKVVALPTATMRARIAGDELLFVDAQLCVRAWSLASGAEIATEGESVLQKQLASLNGAFAMAQADAAALLITPSNADTFVGAGTDQPKYAPTTEAGRARAAAAAAAGHTGRYISPFSSLNANHLLRLSLLSPSGFAFRRHADKLQREAYVQNKKLESAARREANKAKKKEEQKKKKEEAAKAQADMDE